MGDDRQGWRAEPWGPDGAPPLRLFPIALAACLLFSTNTFASPADNLLRRQMARSHIPGAALAVVRDGKIIKLQGFGAANLEWGAATDPDTAFQIASATKLFTGIVLMRLVERGLIGLDDPITKFLPDAPESWRAITVSHLANHTSGLPQGIEGPRPTDLAQTLASTMRTPLLHAPGARSQYGLTDFVILQAILEKVSGQSFPALLDAEIVRPLGLTHTGFSFATNKGPARWSKVLPRRASVYAWEAGAQYVHDGLYPEITYAAGGLFSSGRDLAQVFVALDQGRLLKPESLRRLETPPILTGGGKGGFGVGWTTGLLRGVPVVGHSGGPALADVLRAEDRKLTVIVLTNQQRFYPLLAPAVMALYLPAGEQAPAIADARPQLTAALGKALTSAAAGEIETGLFTDEGAKSMKPFLAELRPILLTALGPMQSAELTAEQAEGEEIVRRYRVTFDGHVMYWTLQADGDGRIISLTPTGEAG